MTSDGSPHQNNLQIGNHDRMLAGLFLLLVAAGLAGLIATRHLWWPTEKPNRIAAEPTTAAPTPPDAYPGPNTPAIAAVGAEPTLAGRDSPGVAAPRSDATAADDITDYRAPTVAPAPTLEPLTGRMVVDPPSRDLIDLAARMGRTAALEADTTAAASGPRTVGDVEAFWVHDIVAERYFEVTARLETLTDNAYFWIQDGYTTDSTKLEAGAKEFSERIVPAIRATFGEEWNPGIDGDPRMHVLHHQPIAGIAGYYSSADEFVTAVEPHSNEREMFYINMDVYTPGSFDWLALLAHEFQHMVHWNADRDEPVWSNEGLSELATTISGYPAASASAFIGRPDTPLLEWNVDPGRNVPDYAASYAFMVYLHGQFGADGIRRIVAAEGNGPTGIEQGLSGLDNERRFDDLFLDWVVANAVDDPKIEGGRFSYLDAAMGPVRAEGLELGENVNQVFPYGTDYYDASRAISAGRLELEFDGDGHVGLLQPVPSASGAVWWSNRGDSSDTRLTRAFDLRGASNPTLQFRLFYELEPNWDYAYFMVSRDDGASWERIATDRTVDSNPNGNNYGQGLTGYSNGWVDSTLDLAPYAGSEILLRFETVTDDAVNLMGLGIDDIHLEAAGFYDDAEADQGWQAEGWMRVPSRLAVRWAPQVILHDAEGLLGVYRPSVEPDGQADIVIEGIPATASAIVAVSQVTRPIRHPVGYTLRSAGLAPYP